MGRLTDPDDLPFVVVDGRKIRLTAKRREWLEHLRDHGPTEPHGRGPQYFACRRAGWSEWMVERGGVQRPRSEVEAGYPGFSALWDGGWRYTQMEVLTPSGRAALSNPES